ncbi:MAG: hypothetical protein VX211_02365, partial [Pseudomonadota bacterium]|nr:hypothetical protein [Pseudomonadota bacterium]
ERRRNLISMSFPLGKSQQLLLNQGLLQPNHINKTTFVGASLMPPPTTFFHPFRSRTIHGRSSAIRDNRITSTHASWQKKAAASETSRLS